MTMPGIDELIISQYFIELGQLSGVAAILRFPLPDIDEDDDESDED